MRLFLHALGWALLVFVALVFAACGGGEDPSPPMNCHEGMAKEGIPACINN